MGRISKNDGYVRENVTYTINLLSTIGFLGVVMLPEPVPEKSLLTTEVSLASL